MRKCEKPTKSQARIIGGLAVSHTPTIGFAVDYDKQQEGAWAPIFKGFEPIRVWLKEQQPDVRFYVLNDHVTLFFLAAKVVERAFNDDHAESRSPV